MQQHLGDRRLLSHGREHVCQRLVCREWRRSPESTPQGSLSTDKQPPFEQGWVSIARWLAGKSSIRKVQCRMPKLASTMPKVGFRKRKLKGQMLNFGCEKMNVRSTELEDRICNLTVESWMSKAKTWMLHKSKLNVECKNVESRV